MAPFVGSLRVVVITVEPAAQELGQLVLTSYSRRYIALPLFDVAGAGFDLHSMSRPLDAHSNRRMQHCRTVTDLNQPCLKSHLQVTAQLQ